MRYTLISLLFLLLLSSFLAYKFEITDNLLKIDQPVKSNLLIMERWIPPYYYYDIVNEFSNNAYEKILITGNKAPGSITLFEQSELIFTDIEGYSEKAESKITLLLEGFYAKKAFSICKVTIGDSVLWNDQVVRTKKIRLSYPILKDDSLILAFTNDLVDKRHDRNLAIQSVSIDGNEVNLFSEKNYVTSGKANQVNYFNNMRDLAAYRLSRKGIPKEKIVSLEAHTSGLSKTYNNGLITAEWMKENGYSSANIITTSYHSKRTLISFQKSSPDIEYGTIAMKSHPSRPRILKELIGVVFIRVVPNKWLNQKPNK